MRKTVGRYQLKAELGSGGMAKVYLAFDPQFEREVAIKVLPRDLLEKPGLRERFTREAKVIASLEHSAIVPVYDFGEDEGQPYLVMRYLRGGNLNDRIDGDPLPSKQILRVLQRMAAALQAAHDRDIIHRDVKPANILYDTHENPHLSDFGIVKLADTATTLTGDAVIGTPQYMSPEQAKGEHNLDSRTDIYSLGVVMFQMLTGQAPYHSDTPMGVAVKHVTDPVPTLDELRPDLAPALNQVIRRAMAKDPEDRYPSVGDLPEAFEQAVASANRTVLGARSRSVEPGPTLVPEEMASATKVATSVGLDVEKEGRGLPWLPLAIGGVAMVVAAIFLGSKLLARGGPGAQPTEAPTQQAVAAQPTPTSAPPTEAPTSAPTPIPIVRFNEDFEADRLGPEWRWLREPVDRWNLRERPGWLTIETEDVSLLSPGGDSPVLLRWTATGDFELTARVDFEPSSNFQKAGIIAYQDDDNFVSVLRAYCEPTPGVCVGDGAYMDNDQVFMEGEEFQNYVGDLPQDKPILLRLVRQGNNYVGSWAPVDGEWTVFAETSADLTYPRLGLYANNADLGAPSIPAQFDFIELSGESLEEDKELSAWSLVIPPGQSIRLAIFTSQSGVPGSISRVMAEVVDMAIADYGSIHDVPIELVRFPSGCTENGGASAASNLVDAGDIAGLVGPTCSSEVRGGLEFLEEAKIVVVSPSATLENLSRYGPSVFNRVILHSGQPGSQEGNEVNELPQVLDFYDEFVNRTGLSLQDDAAPYAAHAYDATILLLNAIQQVSDVYPDGSLVLDRLALNEAVRGTVNFEGITGPISFEDNGDRALP